MKRLQGKIIRTEVFALISECVSAFFVTLALATFENSRFIPWLIVFSIGVVSGYIGYLLEKRAKRLISELRNRKRRRIVKAKARQLRYPEELCEEVAV